MDHLFEFIGHHPMLSFSATVITGFALAFELRLLSENRTALRPSDAVPKINAGLTVIDIRSPEAFRSGHIVGATHLVSSNMDQEFLKLQKQLAKTGEHGVLLCDEFGTIAPTLANRLRKAGISQVKHLRGGMSAWLQDNLPVSRGEGKNQRAA